MIEKTMGIGKLVAYLLQRVTLALDDNARIVDAGPSEPVIPHANPGWPRCVGQGKEVLAATFRNKFLNKSKMIDVKMTANLRSQTLSNIKKRPD